MIRPFVTKLHVRGLMVAMALLAVSCPVTLAQSPDELKELREELEKSRELIERLSNRVEQLEKRGTTSGAPTGDPGDMGARFDEQDERLEELENTLFDLDTRVGDRAIVHAFDAEELDIGGFITQSFTLSTGQDDSNASFNQTLVEILIKAKIDEKWDFFTALGFLREADLDFTNRNEPDFRPHANRVPQIIAWANYRQSDAFNLQIGRFVTPHGIINIEHFPPVLLDINQPQFLRPFSGETIFQNFTIGAQVHGKVFLGANDEDELQYNVYAGAFADNPEEIRVGGRVGYTFGDSGFTLGVNYMHGRREGRGPGALGGLSIVGSRSLTNNDFNVVGADILYDKGRLLWKNEFFISLEEGLENRIGFYTQPAWRINDKWSTFYRFDYLDPGQSLGHSTEHVLGVNFLPNDNIRLRAEYIFKQLNNPSADVGIFQLSATLSF